MRVRDAQLVIKQINNEMLAALYPSDELKFKLTSAKKKRRNSPSFFPLFRTKQTIDPVMISLGINRKRGEKPFELRRRLFDRSEQWNIQLISRHWTCAPTHNFPSSVDQRKTEGWKINSSIQSWKLNQIPWWPMEPFHGSSKFRSNLHFEGHPLLWKAAAAARQRRNVHRFL